MAADPSKRPLPKPTPETEHFWAGARAGELRLQRCDACESVYFPPRPFCPECSSREVSIFTASGNGRLESYVINERGHPAFDGPYSIALVKLHEGPRMMTNIVGCEQSPQALQLDMPVEVSFQAFSDEISLPLFQPVAVPGASS